jgi:hypothetical protein
VIVLLPVTIAGMANAGKNANTHNTNKVGTETSFGDAGRSLKPRQLGVR